MTKFVNNKFCYYLFLIYLGLTLKMATTNCNFARSFYDSLFMLKPKHSLFISPIGLKASLALAALGAVGDTRREIVNIIDTRDDNLEIDILLPDNIKHLQKEQQIYEIEDFLEHDFKNIISPVYKIQDAIFGTPVTLKAMDKLVKKMTHNTIENIFPNSLSRATAAASISALYLNAKWRSEFTSIVKRSFKKPMIHQYGHYSYANLTDLNAAALQLKLQGNSAYLLVLQPNDNDLERLSEAMLQVDLTQIQNRLNRTYMSLYLPIINEIKMSMSLNDMLQNMGMERAFFADNKQFRGMGNCGNSTCSPYLKTVRQHTRFEIDRTGARFVAVTGMQWDRVFDIQYLDDDCACNENEYSTEFADPSEIAEKLEMTVYKRAPEHYYFENKLFLALIRDDEILFLGTLANED